MEYTVLCIVEPAGAFYFGCKLGSKRVQAPHRFEPNNGKFEVLADMKSEVAPSEHKLIAQARRGNHEAFAALVQKHSGKIYGVSLRMLKNREDAEDNVQNVLVKAYYNIGRFEGQSQFSTWLFRITINEALMKLRRHKPERFVNPVDASQDSGAYANYPEIEDHRQNHEREYINRELAHKALQCLNPSLRHTFVLQKAEGWTNRELARAMGITVETVKSRIFRARTRSRRKLELLARQGSLAAYSA